MKWSETNSSIERTRLLACLSVLGIVLLYPLPSHAYAGPGAGFAVLSSLWTLFVAFFYSVYAFFAWPFRQLFRLLRRRKAYGKAQIQRAIILGFDGMDPELTERFIAEGSCRISRSCVSEEHFANCRPHSRLFLRWRGRRS